MDTEKCRLDYEKCEKMLSTCFFLNFAKAMRPINHIFSQEIKNVGLTPTQLSVLVTIGRNQNSSISALGKILNLDESTLTRNLMLLERDGYIQKLIGADKRRKLIALTDEGCIIIENAMPHWQNAQSKLEDIIGNKIWENLLVSLQLFTDLKQKLII